MYPMIEALGLQREQEIAARTRSPLFTHQSADGPFRRARVRRPEAGPVGLPPLSLAKWRRWATRSDVPLRPVGLGGR